MAQGLLDTRSQYICRCCVCLFASARIDLLQLHAVIALLELHGLFQTAPEVNRLKYQHQAASVSPPAAPECFTCLTNVSVSVIFALLLLSAFAGTSKSTSNVMMRPETQ